MEVRMEPLTDERQRCVRFDLDVRPRARAYRFCDHLGNAVHHFDVAAAHEDLVLTAESVAEVFERPPLPESLPECAWAEIDRTVESGEHWDYLHESRFIRSTPALHQLTAGARYPRHGDPLTCAQTPQSGPVRLVRVRAEQHEGGLAHRRCARTPGRCLPGLRAHHGDARPRNGNSCPVRQRLPAPRA